jgi:predicted lactoylglutathione lyase
MQLGAFSISLAVKDLEASRIFYEKFGFKVFGGDASKNWLILKNGDHVIGLFQPDPHRSARLKRRIKPIT